MPKVTHIARGVLVVLVNLFATFAGAGLAFAHGPNQSTTGRPVTSSPVSLTLINVVGAGLLISLIYLFIRVRRSKPPVQENSDVPPDGTQQT